VHLPGTWLWCGQLYWHFGHFLTESASQLWAHHGVRDEVQGVIFTPKRFGVGETLLDWQREYLALAGVPAATRIVTTPTQVERLLVPDQGFGTGDLASGTTPYRAFIKDRFAAGVAPDGPERLYLSRSRFGPRKGDILGEAEIESQLVAEVYEIFHPQEHSLTTQIARMKEARRIVGPDGSAFHLAGLVARPDVRAAMIMRRNAPTAIHLLRQFEGICGAQLQAINAIRFDWTPNGAPPDRL
jgi:capsular polysaccharide biosynthesis protein